MLQKLIKEEKDKGVSDKLLVDEVKFQYHNSSIYVIIVWKIIKN